MLFRSNTGVDIKAIATNGKEYIVRATGSVIKFDGFRKLYIETKDEDSQNDDSAQLPSLQEGDSLESRQSMLIRNLPNLHLVSLRQI